MQVRLLGTVDVVVGGVPRPVSGLRRKAALAALALQPGEVMSTDRLIHIVWGDAPPATAGNTLQSHMSYLRRVLGDRAAIVARPPGYVLNIAGEATDVHVAERLIRLGTQATSPRQGEEHLNAAVGLWRGRSLVDVTELAWFHDQAHRLDHLLLGAKQGLIEVRMALGQHNQLIPELESLRHHHPLHEQIHGLLMLALYRAGRQADAVAAYQALRRTLDEELGIEPSQALHELHVAVLRHDPSLDVQPAMDPAPAQLPPAITVFTGRSSELAQLDDLLPDTNPARPAAVVISAVSGTAGVGKTALAVHWARRVRETFPDGQLYVNLRGFDSGGSVTNPVQAVRGFLDAFGVPPARIPASLEAQTGLYRSLLNGRRVLVVLDNARDSEQVRPLLPGAPGCLALVTSRDRLASLAATEGARLLTVDLLAPAQARELLTSRLDARRTAAEPDAVDAIVAHCAGLPLALAIVAARAAAAPHLPLTSLAAELAQADSRLDTLDCGDPATQLRAVLSWSYRTLSADAARLFRLLGLHPGPDATLAALAGLAGASTARTRKLLAELTRAHLLTEHVPGRYTFHDLLRAYATELAHSQATETARRTATLRMLDHYLHTARTADALLTPQPNPIALPPCQPGAAPETLANHREALTWFTAEHGVLLAAIDQAAAAGFDSHAWQLAATLTTFLDRQAHWRPLAYAQRTALIAARRQWDGTGEANAHRGLGLAHDRLGSSDSARIHYQLALDLFGTLGDHVGLARTHQHLARMYSAQGHYRQAGDHARHSLGHYRAVDDHAGQSAALNHLGWCCAHLGDHRQALVHCRHALALALEFDDLNGQAHIWDSLGYIHRHLGQHQQAVDSYQRAVDLFRRSGDRHSEAAGLTDLGKAHLAVGDAGAARSAWTQARIIVDDLGFPATDPLRVKIRYYLDRDRSGTVPLTDS
ncbi:AfsR/SARP family transcriptional regulator [Actinocrispum wychmicini]|uniref:DNA-binding SARP family transcriptional activator n=1 Tax=Actinocrispum wychmicini TaxID=1213861 RepID=A0A4V2S6F6_9PSEU|nr:AfsR/SARP family transcriptional regulator [Actinocrispum wychmicini]TCO55880.1 DNA-binding SARP family transcriptional activator [Actinocrispum wychmicini]